MQYKIPQNVGIEDKIVGPLTLRQLIILAVGVGVSYVLFSILSRLYELNILEYIIIALPALLGAAFALVRINDVSLTKFILMFLEFSVKPKKRLWDHRGIVSTIAPELTRGKKEEEEKDALSKKAKKASNLKELTQVLDSGGFEHVEEVEHTDMDQTTDDDLVTQAYFGHKKGDSKTENMYWRTKESHKKRLNLFAKLPVTKLKKGTKETEIAKKEIAKAKEEAEQFKQESVSKEVPRTMASVPAEQPMTEAKPKKNPRKRKRKIPQPIRKNNNVNTTNKNKPAQYIPKQKPPEAKSAPKAKSEADKAKGGEFKFEELKKGEIEINLD